MTDRNLEAAIKDGTFRRDLFHRLNRVTVRFRRGASGWRICRNWQDIFLDVRPKPRGERRRR